MKRLVIFDLDGTLLNTIADLAAATNYALTRLGYPTHPTDAYRFFVGNGINKLFERALPETDRTTDNVLRMRAEFVPSYNLHNADLSRQYFPSIRFTAVFGQRENVPAKPHPQVIHEIIGISGVEKAEVAYIGDSGVDMQTGRNAEVTTIGVCWGFRPKSELQEFQPAFLAESPEEIADFLQLS